MTTTLELRFGILAPKLSEQLVEQGHFLPADKTEHLQRDMDAAARLRARGLLSDRSSHILEKRIHGNVAKAIREFQPHPANES